MRRKSAKGLKGLKNATVRKVDKRPTGIEGFDEITGGGLPSGRTTLIAGGPGAGKTLFALQTLVHGARDRGEPGIFVSFEESSRQIMANAEGFGWDLAGLTKKNLFFLDAQPTPELIQSGGFDLLGMLAALETKIRSMRARRIVFDSIDVLLQLLADPRSERCEIYRLHDWLLRHGMTAIITGKIHGEAPARSQSDPLEVVQFMVDCVVMLNHDLCEGVSQRNLRVVKYRGSSFAENEMPYVIAENGLEVAGLRQDMGTAALVTQERVSSGIARLDGMLGGGYFRAASILATGAPGTAKSTLSGAFAEAACLRGEPTLFFSFDSNPSELVRNLSSVGLKLAPHVRSGRLCLRAMRGSDASAEAHFFRIRREAVQHRAVCIVVDPISALAKHGNAGMAHSVVERLVDWCKSRGITLFCTSLLDSSVQDNESTPLEISTIADTWMHLSYMVHSGERNRAITLIKSRGTAHSNQVRELILDRQGITLTDVYTSGGEVLMGTLRWQQEEADRNALRQSRSDAAERSRVLESEEAALAAKLKSLERELAAKRAERTGLERSEAQGAVRADARQRGVHQMRGGDVSDPPRSRRRP